MLDARLRPLIDPTLDWLGHQLARRGVSANAVTWTGFGLGILAVPAIWQEAYDVALVLILCNRLADGLDGAIARQQGPTDLGGYLDIVLDFIFYSAVVFGFALAQPDHALYAAALIFSFIGTGTSFLAFAIFAEKRRLTSERQGKKSLYYLEGIAEGFETLLVLVLMCLFPGQFWIIALVFAAVCWLSTLGRILVAIRVLSPGDGDASPGTGIAR